MNLDPNDPKLTAYALGELDGEERAAIEAQLEQSQVSRQAVDEVREIAAVLGDALQKEPCPALADANRQAVASGVQRRRPPRVRFVFKAALAATVLIAAGFTAWGFISGPFRAGKDPSNASTQFADARKSERWVENPWATGVPPAMQDRRNGVRQSTLATNPTDESGDESKQRRAIHGLEAEVEAFAREATHRADSSTPVDSGRMSGSGEMASGRGLPANLRQTPSRHFGAALVSESQPQNSAGDPSIPFRTGGFGSGRPGQPDDFDGDGQRFHNTEAYDRIVDNPLLAVAQNPLSTFSIDVDTASYANMRRFLTQNMLPPRDSVRIEELINYFTYSYPQPDGDAPFSVNVEVADCPWNAEHRLVRFGLKGRDIAEDQRPASNLVFLVDVSGSMQPANKLPLVKNALRLLVEKLSENDRVSIVVYASDCGVRLPSTSADNKETILSTIERLQSGGSTNGASGIQLAYEQAVANFIRGGTNRVILCTDGDFNVGVTNQGDLTRLIEENAKSGVFLSVLGFGMGNLKDSTMEKLADKGNGNYAYIDTLAEARKVLVEQMGGTLVTIAKDVKLQIEFNPAQVGAFRLIGYENRVLRNEDFNDDKKDAGDIGAGHTVTALYEIVPAGKPINVPGVDPLKYQKPTQPAAGAGADNRELLTLKLRYKAPDGDTSKLLEHPVTDANRRFGDASADFKFAAAVAAFGMLLRDSEHKGTATPDAVLELAEDGRGPDREGYRAEFIKLVRLAKAIRGQ